MWNGNMQDLRLEIQIQSGAYTATITVDTTTKPIDPATTVHSGRTTTINARRAEPPP